MTVPVWRFRCRGVFCFGTNEGTNMLRSNQQRFRLLHLLWQQAHNICCGMLPLADPAWDRAKDRERRLRAATHEAALRYWD